MIWPRSYINNMQWDTKNYMHSQVFVIYDIYYLPKFELNKPDDLTK